LVIYTCFDGIYLRKQGSCPPAMGLHQEQEYVQRHLQELGLAPTWRTYEREKTGTEKAQVLGDAATIVCIFYFGREGEYYGIGTASKAQQLSQRRILKEVLDIPTSQGRRYDLKGGYPAWMEAHTTTPWILESSACTEIKAIILDESIDAITTADISVGGLGDLAQRTSMHVPGWSIYQTLARQFGKDFVHKHPITPLIQKPFYREAI